VAADDGVMPQTVEAINHAKQANVPMIVAINKIDKADSKPERVRSELLQYEVQVESLGGDVLDVEVSATKKTNLDKLLDTIALQAEILDLKANPHRPAEGTVIEAKLDRGRGPVATVLVQRGSLHGGDIVVAGAEWGRVRALVSDTGQTIKDAGPSMPVEVLGFTGTPDAGDRLAVVDTEARAREVTDYRARQKRDKAAARQTGMRGSLEQMMAQVKTAGRKEFPLVIKGDVQGSVEAIAGALDKLGTDEVGTRIIHSGVGGISESDITLAESSGAAIIGFNVRAHKEAREVAERTGTEIRYYNIIYNLVDDVKAAMSGLLTPARRECPPDPRQCRHPRGQAVAAQALQGRCPRSAFRPGMRHGVRGLSGHARGRRDRVLSRGDGAAVALSPILRPTRTIVVMPAKAGIQ